MKATPSSWSAEELVAQLAGSVQLRSVHLPAELSARHPRLDAVVRRSGAELTTRATGQEELVCVAAAPEPDATVAEIDRLLLPSACDPFLLVLPHITDEPGSAVEAARRLLASRPGWLARDLPEATGPVMLAPLQRLLEADTVAGEWHGASPPPLRSADSREVDRLRILILEERAWVAEQANRIGQSLSWRLGHRLVKLGRAFLFRRDRGTDVTQVIRERMENSELP